MHGPKTKCIKNLFEMKTPLIWNQFENVCVNDLKTESFELECYYLPDMIEFTHYWRMKESCIIKKNIIYIIYLRDRSL